MVLISTSVLAILGRRSLILSLQDTLATAQNKTKSSNIHKIWSTIVKITYVVYINLSGINFPNQIQNF